MVEWKNAQQIKSFKQARNWKKHSSVSSGKFAQDAFASDWTWALHLDGSHQENNWGDRIKIL